MILTVLAQLIVLLVNVDLKENLLNIFYYAVSDFKMPEICWMTLLMRYFDLSACLTSENLLLASMSVGVTRNGDKDTKAALFQFISETQVKL